MTDNTETDVSTKVSTSKASAERPPSIKYTEEEKLLLGEPDKMILMKCKSCGNEEEVEEWVLEEFLEMKLLQGESKRRYSCQCSKCDQIMFKK